MDENFKRIQPLLAIESDEVRFLGLWGMGGIGKTTIAKTIFDRYSSRYEGCCFLQNVREESQKYSPQYLYEKLITELLEGENLLVKGSAQSRSMYVKIRLSRKKVLIVLDDVDTLDKLEHLAREQICLGAGSRVIVKTRDEQILIAARVHDIYKVQELSFESSLELFCLKAFHKSYPENGYEELSDMAIRYAEGIPLALKVLGSYLCSRSAVAWEREHKDNVIRFLDSCDFFGGIGIDNLQRKALITISPEDTIQMHDLIQQMGLQIVFKESTKDVKKRSRLKNPEVVRNLLENSKGEKSAEGIMCDLSQIGDLCLNANSFKNMPHLRFLKLHACSDQRTSNVYVPKTLKLFCAKLRYLEWNSYPLNSLPSRFCTEKLVELRMPNGQFSKLWDGTQDLANLTMVDLYGCKQLVELPDFSKAIKLKTMMLKECEKLCQLHPSILSLQTLEYLDVYGCKELKSVKCHFKSLKSLCANECSSLEEFSMQSLYLTLSGIKSSQNEFCGLPLEYLRFCDCTELVELPHNMKALSRLRCLVVSGYCGLRSIPELPPSLKVLYADDCTSLERIFSLKEVFSLNRREISFVNCTRLEEESRNDIMKDAHLTIFRNFLLWSTAKRDDQKYGSVYYPRKKVPEWFRFRTEEEASIIIELEQCNYQLLGFFFCCVVSQKLPPHFFNGFGGVGIRCEYRHLRDGIKHRYLSGWGVIISKRRLNSDHIIVWTDPSGSSNVFSKIEECRDSDDSDDDGYTCNQKISFRFSVNRPEKWLRVEEREEEDDEECYIKGCGVIPVYASTVLDAIQNIELELNLNPHHDSIPSWMDLDTLKSCMIRKSRGKSKQYDDSS
ncbi:hypothetical protein PIB30_033365 [Stylosanthes scabra]|uniref:ADP-ribosyl cyclase/cyclic ADP-ribose hydrolase n=1 Tax=Stylosanthes scabra TaxID=79078 RepID=A0ABU6YBB5_9FABA|nr:hypothetical protein [Stylosanthes scabra]